MARSHRSGIKVAGIRQLVSTSALVFLLIYAMIAHSASIVNSKHDLSYPVVDPNSDQPCVFCHTPHFSGSAAPLWNRKTPDPDSFTMYNSVTMDTAHPGRPNGLSLACLGCHDGVNAADNNKHDLLNAPGPGGIPDTTSYPRCQRCHPDFYGFPAVNWMGQDLGDDHPISINYPSVLEDPDFNIPPDTQRGWDDIKLFSGNIECPSCHDVHDPGITPFLRISNNGSALCYACHIK